MCCAQCHWEMDGRIDTLKLSLSPAAAAIINQSLPSPIRGWRRHIVQSGAKGNGLEGHCHNESRKNGTESNKFSLPHEQRKSKSYASVDLLYKGLTFHSLRESSRVKEFLLDLTRMKSR